MLQNRIAAARDHICLTQGQEANLLSAKLRTVEFKVGDKVLLNTEHYNLQLLSQKLAPRYLGPLTVLEIRGPNTVRIEVPPRLACIKPLQNVEHLKPYVTLPPAVGPTHVPVGPELVDDTEEYEVEDIIAHCGAGNRVEYLVRFTSYDAADDLWLPAHNLKNAPDIVSAYHARQRDQVEPRAGTRQRAPRRLRRLGHVWNYGGP
eukprot:674615-Rhodomonas_salina.1